MENQKNQWQNEEEELNQPTCPIIEPPIERPSYRMFITVIGPEEELNNVMEYLKEPFQTNQFELPAFTKKPSLGSTALVINLNTFEIYKTENGLQMGEWRRYYVPEQYPELVKELMQEAKRIKHQERLNKLNS